MNRRTFMIGTLAVGGLSGCIETNDGGSSGGEGGEGGAGGGGGGGGGGAGGSSTDDDGSGDPSEDGGSDSGTDDGGSDEPAGEPPEDGDGEPNDTDDPPEDDPADGENETDEERTYLFTVVVQESQGAYGLEDIEVTVSSGGETVAVEETNIDGIAEFRLPAGEYTLTIAGYDSEQFENPGEASVMIPEHENHYFSLVEQEPVEPNESEPPEENETKPPADDGNATDPNETAVAGVLL